MKPEQYKVGNVTVLVRLRQPKEGEQERNYKSWEIVISDEHGGVRFDGRHLALVDVNIRAAHLARILESLKDYENWNTRMEEDR